MRKKIEWEWEALDCDTARAKVIGGWLVKTGWCPKGKDVALSTVFVADRDHEWHVIPPMAPGELTVNKGLNPADFQAS